MAVLAAPLAFARILANTIDDIATVAAGGRELVLTGPIRYDRVQRLSIGVT